MYLKLNFLRHPIRQNYTITASDNCVAVGTLQALMPDVQVFSPCYNESNSSQLLVNLEVRRSFDTSAALELLADIEMLRRGHHFVGLFDSNLVRMVHRLRYPHLNYSHGLAEETYEDSRRTLNQHMDNIHWET